ncbi:hypothetical protein [Streptomyces sp. NPDC047014]|uniref:hypothetical protein n=1 Tax=Streptomyces sp. NPDC047014 TaxID=3155736 RepID=UPI0033E47FDD
MTDRPEPPPPAIAVLRRWAPPPALVGFVLLLSLLFGGAYGVGSLAGPVAPGMHATDPAPPDFDSDPGRRHGHTGPGAGR